MALKNWHPGYYAWIGPPTSNIDFTANRLPLYTQDQTVYPTLTGYWLNVYWVNLETSFNTYTLAQIAGDLAWALTYNKKLIINVITGAFSNNDPQSLPGYLWNPSDPNYSTSYTPFYYTNAAGTGSAAVTRPAEWVASVYARVNALTVALLNSVQVTLNGTLYTGLNSIPCVEAFAMTEETTPSEAGQITNFASLYPSYSDSAWQAAAVSIAATVGANCNPVQAIVPFNYVAGVNTSPTLAAIDTLGDQLVTSVCGFTDESLSNATFTIGGVTYNYAHGIAYYTGQLPSRANLKGKLPYFFQVQPPDLFQTNAQLLAYWNLVGATHVAYVRDTNWVGTTAPFLQANPLTTAAYPGSYPTAGAVTLWGQDGHTWGTTATESLGTSGYSADFDLGYVASPGAAATVYVQLGTAVTATSIKFSLYNAAGALVISVTLSGASGLVSASLGGLALTAQTYRGVVTPNSGYFNLTYLAGSSNFKADQFSAAAFSFTSPPSTLPAPTVSDIGHEYQMWIVGAGGNNYSLSAAAGAYAYIGGNSNLNYVPHGGGTGHTLWGQDGSAWGATATESQGGSGYALGYNPGYLASAGIAGTVFVKLGTAVTATGLKFCLYDSTGALVSGTPVALSGVSGLVSASLIGVSLTAQNYKGVVVPNTGYFNATYLTGSSNYVNNSWNAAAFPYATPPSTYPTPTLADVGHEYQMWITGTFPIAAGAGIYGYTGGNAALNLVRGSGGPKSYVLLAMPGNYNYEGAPSHADYNIDANTGVYAYESGTSQIIHGGGSVPLQAGDALYPSNIRGLKFDVTRTPKWNTGRHTSMSGKESRIIYQPTPLIHFELEYELLNDALTVSDLKALVGLFNNCQGRLDSFLFTDPDFNSVTAQPFGTTTGVAGSTYQLVATYQNSGGPGITELVQNLNGVPLIYLDGSLYSSSNYTIGPTGLLSLNVATLPGAGHALTWTGSFYYRCAFDEDDIDWTKFMSQWWQAKIKFTSVLL